MFTFGIGTVFTFHFPLDPDGRFRCSQESFGNLESRLYRIQRKFGLHTILSPETVDRGEARMLQENEMLIQRMLG